MYIRTQKKMHVVTRRKLEQNRKIKQKEIKQNLESKRKLKVKYNLHKK